MHKPQTRTLSAPMPPEQAFAAVLTMIESGNLNLQHTEPEQNRVYFTSGKTALSWGQEYIVTIAPASGGSTLELITGSHDEAPKALLDGWKNGRAANKMLETLQGVLGGSA